jgi:hypothetical protein
MGLLDEDLQGGGRIALVGRHLLDGDVLGGHAVGSRRDVVFTQPGIIFIIYAEGGTLLYDRLGLN